jgi:hypothetical protein
MVARGEAVAQSAPSHDDLPPFEWSEFDDVSHVGQPLRFDFGYYLFDGAM